MCFVGPREVLSPYLYPNFCRLLLLWNLSSSSPNLLERINSPSLQQDFKTSKFFNLSQYLFLLFLHVLETLRDLSTWQNFPKYRPGHPYQTLHHRAVRRSDFQSFRDQPWRTTSIWSKVQPRFLLGKKKGRTGFSQTIYRKHHKWWVSCQMGSLKNNKFANSIHGVFVARWCVWRGNWSLKWTKHWSLVFLNLQLLISP